MTWRMDRFEQRMDGFEERLDRLAKLEERMGWIERRWRPSPGRSALTDDEDDAVSLSAGFDGTSITCARSI